MHSESPNLSDIPDAVRLRPAALTGTITAVDAKSYAHRLLMAAALADVPTRIRCRTRSADILATVRVMRALGRRLRTWERRFSSGRSGCASQRRAFAPKTSMR